MPTDEQKIAVFKDFVAKSPDDPFPRYSLAMAYRSAGKLDEAVRTFEELSKRTPDYVPQWLMRGQTLEALGRKEDAAAVYQRGIEISKQAGNEHAFSELSSALELIRGG